MTSTTRFVGWTTVLLAGVAHLALSAGNAQWNQLQKFVAGDRDLSGGTFGSGGVAVSGDYAIIGDFLNGTDADGANPLTEAGAAYIFKRDLSTGLWTEQQKLVAAERTAHGGNGQGGWFGRYVAISGNTAFVSDLLEGISVFQRESGTCVWIERQKIAVLCAQLAIGDDCLMAGIQ